jgi:ligand-binding SRPBCC domain-containing protein
MKSSQFSASTILPASAETMFAFHSDPHNLEHVMPPTMKVTALQTEVPAREGGLIDIRCRDWGVIPMHWICRWNTVQPPQKLIDEMIQGPFEQFHHQHLFETIDANHCRMHDIVTYRWGRSWWGKVVSEIFVRGYLMLLFRYRHYRTIQWARSQTCADEK